MGIYLVPVFPKDFDLRLETDRVIELHSAAMRHIRLLTFHLLSVAIGHNRLLTFHLLSVAIGHIRLLTFHLVGFASQLLCSDLVSLSNFRVGSLVILKSFIHFSLQYCRLFSLLIGGKSFYCDDFGISAGCLEIRTYLLCC